VSPQLGRFRLPGALLASGRDSDVSEQDRIRAPPLAPGPFELTETRTKEYLRSQGPSDVVIAWTLVQVFVSCFDRRALAVALRDGVAWKAQDVNMSDVEVAAMWRLIEHESTAS